MNYNELLQVTIFLFICLYFLRIYYKRSKNEDFSDESAFSFILRFRASVFLIVASIICILKIIVEIIKIMRSD